MISNNFEKHLQRLLLAFTLMFAFLAAGASNVHSEETWKAGVAAVAITPPKMMWMSGYGGRTKRAEGVEHDLWAKALVLEDSDGQRAVFVTLDLVGIDRDTSSAICSELAAKHELKRDQIALNCSHTHCGPAVGRNLQNLFFLGDEDLQLIGEYTNWLQRQIVRSVSNAIDKLEPSRLEYGEGNSAVAVNRRNNRHDDVLRLREQGELRGPVDHSVPVLRVTNAQNQVTAILFGYACHPTKLTNYYRFCGDYVGFAQLKVEFNHPDAVAMFWQACGGDQTPWPRGGDDIQATHAVGDALAASVEEALLRPLTPVQGHLKTSYNEIRLNLSTLPKRDELEAQSRSSNRYHARLAKELLASLDAGEELQASYDHYPVQVWQIGDGLTFVALGGEVVVDYAIRLKDEIKSEALWIAGYSNDVMAYIPSQRVLMEGGYEGRTSMVYYGFPVPWEMDIEEKIVGEVHRLFKTTAERD